MKIVGTSSVWFQKYQPQCIQDLVIPGHIKEKLAKYVSTQDIPNIGLFSSNPGTGKSSTACAIIKEINGEALWINASMEKGIDVLRGKVQKFASQSSFDDKIKIVVMDEFDHFSKDGQAAFRGFIDEFSLNCRFIFTGNYKEKIIQPLLDRLEVYDFNSFEKSSMVKPIFVVPSENKPAVQGELVDEPAKRSLTVFREMVKLVHYDDLNLVVKAGL
jgi:replication factor C small subunit